MSPAERSSIVKHFARELGFDRVGVTPAARVPQAEYYRNWLAAGHHGTMDYLARGAEARADPRTLLNGARSIICVAINYHRPDDPAPTTADEPTGRVAQYARGADYHTVLHTLLGELIRRLRHVLDTPFEARPFVDTGPLLERSLAAQAGLGWIGKNTCLMHPALGSYLFLGEIVTTLELAADNPMPDHCGSCTRCLEACPTDAFIAPYQLDASRCIAYLTIERRAALPDALASRVGEWVFGCDVCQEVCPHNSGAPDGTHADLMADRTSARLPLRVLSEMSSGDYRRLTRGTALGRASRGMWQRNARNCLALPSRGVSRRLADMKKLAGKFIVVDGPDGSGKGTQIERLTAYVAAGGGECVRAKDPGGTPIGERIRHVLLGYDLSEMDVRCEALLFMASRAQLVAEVVRPAIAGGKTVVCDRFISATCAYQVAAGFPREDVIRLGELAVGTTWPDLTLILDVPVEIGFERTGRKPHLVKRGRNEAGQIAMFDGATPDAVERRPLEYHRRVRQIFLDLPQFYPGAVRIIDANRPADDVFAAIREALSDAPE